MVLNYAPSKTSQFFSKMNKMWSIFGLHNMWVENYDNKITKLFHRLITFCLCLFIVMELVAFYTQQNLTEKQSNDRLVFGISHPVLFSYYIACEYHVKRFQALLLKLCITLKEEYNDPEVEKHMIKKATYYSIAYVVNCSIALIAYGFDALMQLIQSGGSFITVVIAWPDVEDMSVTANAIRLISYIIWWAFMGRVSAAFIAVMTTVIAMSHQYKNLQSYFYSLNDVFDNADEENIEEKQLKYEESLKVGIKLHSETLWCTRQCQTTCSLHFSGQIIINVCVFSLLMLQMVNSERTLVNTLPIITTSIALLGSSGFLMWNAGDITVEAARVPTAMYLSGWQHCRGKTSERVGKLLVVAMTQAQKHVVIRSLGIVEISYQSYLSIVKSSYSAFSLLY